MSKRTVKIPLEEYEELKRFKDKANIGTWYRNYKNGFLKYSYKPETEAIKKLQTQVDHLQEKLKKYRNRPTMETAKETAREMVEQVKKENKELKQKIYEIRNKKTCEQRNNSKISKFWSGWF